MKKKLNQKLMKQTVDTIENNIERCLHRVHVSQAEYIALKQLKLVHVGDTTRYLAQIKTEFMSIIESFLWLRKYNVSKYADSFNYTSKDGLDTVELCTVDYYSQFGTEMVFDKSKEELFPLTKKNAACCGFKLHIKLTISEDVERELDYTITRKTVDDILREKIEKRRGNYGWQ